MKTMLAILAAISFDLEKPKQMIYEAASM